MPGVTVGSTLDSLTLLNVRQCCSQNDGPEKRVGNCGGSPQTSERDAAEDRDSIAQIKSQIRCKAVSELTGHEFFRCEIEAAKELVMCSARFCAGLLIAAVAAWTPAGFAQSASAALPVLVVKASTSGSPSVTTFDRDELEDMGMTSVKTTTPWNEGVVEFEGVPIDRILAEAGVSGTVATVTALNDYSVDIPVADFSEFGVILAIKRDGQYMPVDDQGPFFVIYPFDSDPALQAQPYHGRAVWQVKEILVE